MMKATPRASVLHAFADLLLDELIAAHGTDVVPIYAEAVKTLRTQRAKQRADNNAATLAKMQVEGPPMWAEWHRRALQWGQTRNAISLVKNDDTDYLNGFANRIPCGDCKMHFMQLLRENKPDFTPANYFDYTVKIHNLVNASCSPPKQQLSVEQARTIWK